MVIKQTKAIIRLYEETLSNGLESLIDETPLEILEKCQKVGKYVFRPDTNSCWAFVRIINEPIPMVRMVFAFNKGNSSAVAITDKITDLVGDVERELTFVDTISITKTDEFSYLVVTKNIK